MAAKRAARAEAREIRLKELERQQKEVRPPWSITPISKRYHCYVATTAVITATANNNDDLYSNFTMKFKGMSQIMLQATLSNTKTKKPNGELPVANV